MSKNKILKLEVRKKFLQGTNVKAEKYPRTKCMFLEKWGSPDVRDGRCKAPVQREHGQSQSLTTMHRAGEDKQRESAHGEEEAGSDLQVSRAPCARLHAGSYRAHNGESSHHRRGQACTLHSSGNLSRVWGQEESRC